MNDFINISPGSNGSCKVFLDEGVLIGTNAAIREGQSINKRLNVGAFSAVRAGAVVLKDLSPNQTARGIPALLMERLEK